MAFNLMESLRRLIPGKTASIGTVKPGDTTKTLQDRLGLGNIQFKQAQQAINQGAGTFVPGGTQPLTLGAGGVPIQTGVPGIPVGTQPITTQPQPLTVTPGQLQQPTVQPQPQVLGVQTTVQPQAPAITPQTQDITRQIEETKAKLKAAQAAKAAQEAGYTVSAPGEKPTITTDAYGRALGEKTPFEQYAEAIRKAQEPLTAAYTKYTETLANLPSSANEYTRLAKEKGIPELEGKIKDITGKAYGVEAQIEALPEDVKKRVQDFLVTQGQYERLTTAEAKPLTSLYNALSRAQGMALQDLEFRRGEVNTMLGLVEKDTQRKLQALELGTKLAGLGAEMETGLAGKAFEEAKTGTKELATRTQEAAIVDLIRQGVTDPAQIYDYMNYREGGVAIPGIPVSLELIEKTLKSAGISKLEPTTSIKEYNLARQQGFTGTFQQWQDRKEGQFTDLESRKLEQAGLSGATRQEQLNYLYGKEQRIQELLKKANFGANLETLTPDELAELYANL